MPTAPDAEEKAFSLEEAKSLVRQFFAAIDGDFTDPNSTTSNEPKQHHGPDRIR